MVAFGRCFRPETGMHVVHVCVHVHVCACTCVCMYMCVHVHACVVHVCENIQVSL